MTDRTIKVFSKLYVYILASKKNGTLYIGVTSDLIKRVFEHKSDVVEGFTKKYTVHILVYYEVITSFALTVILARPERSRRAVRYDSLPLLCPERSRRACPESVPGWILESFCNAELPRMTTAKVVVMTDPRDAIRREKQLKAWKRDWKIQLIEKNNPDWEDLYESLI